MEYFVIWNNGQKFGPADIAKLNQWIQESRINQDTILESVIDGNQIKAGDLHGLVFPQTATPDPTSFGQSTPSNPLQQPQSPTQQPQSPAQHQQNPIQQNPSQPQQPIYQDPTHQQQTQNPNEQYYVIGSGGQKYGPATVAALTQWAAENRLTPASDVEASSTGQRFKASQIPGIVFPQGAGTTGLATGSTISSANPYSTQSNYPRTSTTTGYTDPNAGNTEFTWSIICSILSFICCGCFSAIIGVVLAYKARDKGHPNAKVAIILGWVALGISLVGGIFYVALGAFDSFGGF